jgi:hypothetical protein
MIVDQIKKISLYIYIYILSLFLNFFIYSDYFFIVIGEEPRENIIENNIYINQKMMDYARKLFFNEVGIVTFLAE